MPSDADSLLGRLQAPSPQASACESACATGQGLYCGFTCSDHRLRQACELVTAAEVARAEGDEEAARRGFLAALGGLRGLIETSFSETSPSAPVEVFLLGVRCALECGEVGEARRIMGLSDRELLLSLDGMAIEVRNIEAWPDAWLVACIRLSTPDERSLDVLARRHWPSLYGRCHLLTAQRETAADLAQEAWCRVLRRRHTLKPGGNFPAFLHRIATNLWRDRLRANERAGMLAENRLCALDATVDHEEGEGRALIDLLPDAAAVDGEAARRIHEELGVALARLDPLLRDVLVARYLEGESCAEIGRRFRRTEQTISGWIRRALHEIRTYLRHPDLEGRPQASP